MISGRSGLEHPGDRVDPRDLESLLRGERRQDRRQPAREHRLPGSRAGRRGGGCVHPAAAISSARRARSWPRTSARSSCGSSRWMTVALDPGLRVTPRRAGRRQPRRDGAPGPARSRRAQPRRRNGPRRGSWKPGEARSLGQGEHAADRPQAPVEARARRPPRARQAAREGSGRRRRGSRARSGRSKPEPSFRSPAGARLTVIRREPAIRAPRRRFRFARGVSPPGRRGRRARRSRSRVSRHRGGPRPRRGGRRGRRAHA